MEHSWKKCHWVCVPYCYRHRFRTVVDSHICRGAELFTRKKHVTVDVNVVRHSKCRSAWFTKSASSIHMLTMGLFGYFGYVFLCCPTQCPTISSFYVQWQHILGYVASIKSSSSLKITHRCLRHASPYLWNQLPTSLRIPHPSYSSPSSDLHSNTRRFKTCYALLSPSVTFSLIYP